MRLGSLTVAWRRLLADRAFAAITIGGLALGLAGCLLIVGYVRYERTYDAWVPGADRIYQVQSTIRPPGQPVVRTQASAFVVGERIAADFPAIEAVTSVSVGKTVSEQGGAPVFIDATTVDPDFFRVFPLRFVAGSAATAFADPLGIVLSEREARRWFGTADALGRRLTLGAGDGRRDYRVSGVIADLPRNTNLTLDLLFRRDTATLSPDQRSWGNFDQQHYVRLRPGADAAAIDRALPAWEQRVIPTVVIGGRPAAMSDVFDFHLMPIAKVHLGAAQEGAYVPGGDARTLATFVTVALLTLGMAVINFVNLSTARATRRAREVALRKVLGATRRQLIAQFFLENLLLCLVAVLIALALVEVATPPLGALLGADLPVRYRGMIAPALALLAVAGVAGGLYPAIHLSRFRPADVLRSGRAPVEGAGGGRLRGALVVAQFAIAIGLVASTAVIGAQTRFVQRVDPGYARDGLVQIDNAWRFSQGAEYDAARRAMLALPGITAVGRTQLGLGSQVRAVRLIRVPGGGGGGRYVSVGLYGIDAEFLPAMQVPLLAGRGLGDRIAADRIAGETAQALAARGVNIVVNAAAVRQFGFGAPAAAIGRVIEAEQGGGTLIPGTIVGVVADMRYRSAREAVEPMVFTYDPAQANTVIVRFAARRPADVMADLSRVWRRFESALPFEARFVDDVVAGLYAADRARTMLFGCFSALAIAIACLGLYSLAAFVAERRTREIGIRKVLGARVRHIVRLLGWQFARPVIVAGLLAWPIAWWAMRDWLNGFDVRIALTPLPFLLAGLLALGIALATVAGHALRVARTHPVHALRHE